MGSISKFKYSCRVKACKTFEITWISAETGQKNVFLFSSKSKKLTNAVRLNYSHTNNFMHSCFNWTHHANIYSAGWEKYVNPWSLSGQYIQYNTLVWDCILIRQTWRKPFNTFVKANETVLQAMEAPPSLIWGYKTPTSLPFFCTSPRITWQSRIFVSDWRISLEISKLPAPGIAIEAYFCSGSFRLLTCHFHSV